MSRRGNRFRRTSDDRRGCTEFNDDTDCTDPLVFAAELLHNRRGRNNMIRSRSGVRLGLAFAATHGCFRTRMLVRRGERLISKNLRAEALIREWERLARRSI